MYTLPNKLKLFAIIFMVVGAIGVLYGFFTMPGNTAEVKEMMAGHHEEKVTDHVSTLQVANAKNDN